MKRLSWEQERRHLHDRSLNTITLSVESYPRLIAITILPLSGSLQFALITKNPIPLLLYLVMSPITFVLYTDDKARAQHRAWRIAEKTLHLSEFAGGWLGGFVAQRIIRHKNAKPSYQMTFWSIVSLHLGIWLIFWLDMQFFNKILLRALLKSI